MRKDMDLRNKQLAFALLLHTLSSGVIAGEGSLGRSTNADISISMSIQPSIQIETVEQIQLDITDRTQDASFEESFCVRGTHNAKYSIIAYSTIRSASEFSLARLDDSTLPYTVTYRGDLGRNAFDTLIPGTPSPVYEILSKDGTCHAGNSFRIIFRSEDLEIATSGLYRGSLTLLVSPV